MIGRLQLDEFSREGEVRLVSIGDPQHELFQAYAHRFRVFVPAAWVRTAQAESMVRRALNAEKPAHTSYDLCLVEPRLRVGVQCTVGLDTIVGDVPLTYLACLDKDCVVNAGEAPSRPPHGLLGYDTVLAARPARRPGGQAPPPLVLGPGTRLE